MRSAFEEKIRPPNPLPPRASAAGVLELEPVIHPAGAIPRPNAGIVADWLQRGWIVEAVSQPSGKGTERRKPVGVYKRGPSRPEPKACEFEPVEDDEA
jgi:hypothetical protein